MAVIYEKTYRPIHVNVDAELLGQLDEYRSPSMPRSQHIHAALRMYVDHLEKQGNRKSVWLIGQRKKL